MENTLRQAGMIAMLLPAIMRCYPGVSSAIVCIWDNNIHPRIGNKIREIVDNIVTEPVKLYNASKPDMLRPIPCDQLTLRAYGVMAQYLKTTHVVHSHFGDLQRTQQAVIQSIKPAGPRNVVPPATVNLTDQEDEAVAMLVA
ncbi:hypothetical protein N0V85_007447 [Neurospora sp. IMI 360204]|nr:hypothetical protein N0V85_007447 [Neurospora sp. IMI 360204]